jgi:hypothetical protein
VHLQTRKQEGYTNKRDILMHTPERPRRMTGFRPIRLYSSAHRSNRNGHMRCRGCRGGRPAGDYLL